METVKTIIAGWLPVIENNGSVTLRGAITIYPHVCFFPVLYPGIINTHHLYRCFVGMDDVVFIDKLVKPVIKQGQIFISTIDDPVCHSVRGKIDAIALVGSGLTF